MIPVEDQRRLLELLRGGSASRDEALRELFERTRERLYSLALRMTGRADLADDAVQETFVDVLRAHSSFRGDARLTTWLFRVAVRAATRVAARGPCRSEPLPDELPSPTGDPSVRGERADAVARVLRAMSALPAPQRAVLALNALQDLPQTEIATILGVPEGTVYSRLHHARERLRQSLSEQQRS